MYNKIAIRSCLQILLIAIIIFLTYSLSLATGGGAGCYSASTVTQSGNCTYNAQCTCSGSRTFTRSYYPAGTCPPGKSCTQTGTGNGLISVSQACSGICANSEGSCVESLCTVSGGPLNATYGPYPIYGCQ
jgi:hypothetical protein